MKRAFATINSSFQARAAGQSRLKQFFKYTHPDFFGNAPDKVKETNLKSVQELNEYLTNLSNPLYQAPLESRVLTFYVKPEGKQEVKEEGYTRFKIELLPLRG